MNVLFIDNFDSFVYNLVDEFRKLNCNVLVYRNNIAMKILGKVVNDFKPKLIVISPGPSTPQEAGNSLDVIKRYYRKIPIFGVCLGHQCIIEYFGGLVKSAPEIVHGKASKIYHDGKGIFTNIDNPFQGGRYHSLAGYDIPDCLEVSARTAKIVMAVRHKKFKVIGVQFHPESILTPVGSKIIKNLVELVRNDKGCY